MTQPEAIAGNSVLAALSDARMSTRTLPFFVIALGFTWLLQLPAVLAHFGVLPGGPERYLLPAALAGFGPLVGAVLAAWMDGRTASVRALFRRMLIWRVNVVWYVIALAGFAAIYAFGAAVYRATGGAASIRWVYPPENVQHVMALLLIPFVEEIGWRGFALPRLELQLGRRTASVVLGALWTAWHGTMWILQGLDAAAFVTGAVVIFAGSVLFSAIYNHTRGSLLLAVLAHTGVHLSNPFHAFPGSMVPMTIYAVALTVTAAIVLAIDPAWIRSPQSS